MTELDEILRVLNLGGTILYPTDTIWALGCDATSASSVSKIISIRGYNCSKPLIVMVDSIEMLHEYVEEVHPRLETLLTLHRRPLTVMYENSRSLAPNILQADSQTAAIRVTHDPFCKQIISELGKPIVAVSASVGEHHYPSSFEEVDLNVVTKVDYVVRHGQDHQIQEDPSVIVKLTDRAELFFVRE